jgi:hypothetical protein
MTHSIMKLSITTPIEMPLVKTMFMIITFSIVILSVKRMFGHTFRIIV